MLLLILEGLTNLSVFLASSNKRRAHLEAYDSPSA